MTRKRWCWGSLAGLLMLAGILGGCNGDDHDGSRTRRAAVSCLASGNPMTYRRSPTSSTPGLQAMCHCRGNLFAATDVDIYGILIEETLTWS